MSECQDCNNQEPDWPIYTSGRPGCEQRAMTHAGVWADDSQVDALTIRRMDPVRGGSVLVSVEVMP